MILDLKDAVAAGAKEMARSTLGAAFNQLAAAACPVIVRVKAEDTPFHAADLDTCRSLPLRAVMVPKVEAADTVARVAAWTGMPMLALIESARGLAAARTIAASGARLFFGSIDYAAYLGCAHTREALLLARLELVLGSRLWARPAGRRDGQHQGPASGWRRRCLCRLARLCGQAADPPGPDRPAAAGLQPDPEQLAWARRVLEAGRDAGAATLDGAMVDAPVRLRAEQLERRIKPRG